MSKARTMLVLALSLLAGPTTLPAQPLAERIETLLERYHELGRFNGAALVAADGEVVFEAGFGQADMAWDVPNRPDTRFRISSTTKQFTAALVLTLVEEGRIELDGRVTDYLADYPAAQGDRVTIHHLLSHSSGIPSYTTPAFMADAVRDPHPPDSLLALFSGLALEFEPGARWAYSNSGFILLGAIVETVTGKPYEVALRERVLDPLGLDDTGYGHYEEVIERLASGYVRTEDGYARAPYLDTTVPYSAGMLYSTVRDLYAWDQALYGAGPFRDSATTTLLFEPRARLPPELSAEAHLPPSYAYGWFVGDVPVAGRKVRVIEHGGGIFGFATAFQRMPEERNTIILLDNTSSASVREIARGIMTILYGGRPRLPQAAS